MRPLRGPISFIITARKRSCGKVMFLHVSVFLGTEGVGGVGVVSQHALQVSRLIPTGKVEESGRGGVSRPTLDGGV